ncbi:MAG: PEGA domain-containing protein [Planctomycetota bacterium]|nr:PEGA domain-containing protein [Planctomycetota bacterium]
MRISSAALLAVFLFSSGCSSLITVTSHPKGATIRINGQYYGVTPSTFPIGSSTFGSYQITLEKDGYDTVTATMTKELYVGRLIADIIFFFPLALINAAGPQDVPAEHRYILIPESKEDKAIRKEAMGVGNP